MAELHYDRLKVRLTFFEEVLGTSPNNEQLYDDYIASKAPDARSRAEEIEAIGTGDYIEKQMTVFPRTEDGKPFVWDYQIKGMFKDNCGGLRKVDGSDSSKLSAYKKTIDKNIFVDERRIPIQNYGRIGEIQRPLRADTPQGPRNSLAHSETVPAGSYIEFTVKFFNKLKGVKVDLIDVIREWLDFGAESGFGQWRNSGKGRFTWEEIQ